MDRKESARFYIDSFHGYSKPKEITAVSSASLYHILSKIGGWYLVKEMSDQGIIHPSRFLIRTNIRLAFMFANAHLL